MKMAQQPSLRGYLIVALGTKSTHGNLSGDEEISAGDHPHAVTLCAPSAGTMFGTNLGFPGLRRFCEWRRLDLSQLLQIATLAYI
jgi:hypothetical protein